MPINQSGFSRELPPHSPYYIQELVPETLELNHEQVANLAYKFNSSGIGHVTVKAAKQMTPEFLRGLPVHTKRALKFTDSVIVDADKTGKGIGNLIDAVPVKEQAFSTLEIDKALLEAGLIPKNSRVLKMGASGGFIENNRTAEVIETQLFDTRQSITDVRILSKAAWSDDNGKIHINSLEDERRVLLENEFLVTEKDIKESSGVLIQIEVQADNVDLYSLIAEATREVGLQHYTVRCTIEGPICGKMSVIKALPEQKIVDGQGIGAILVANEIENSGIFHFVGSRTDAVSRQEQRWGEITGNKVYSPNGHYHGYSQNEQVGGHVSEIIPQPGSVISLIIEPAKVVQVKRAA